VKTALVPFLSHIERDGLLITGQNPLSAAPTAKALIEVLESSPEVIPADPAEQEKQWQERADAFMEAKPDDVKP